MVSDRNIVAKDNRGYSPWLGTLFVKEKYRGRHFSQVLIENACQHVKKIGYKNLYLATEHIGLYEKFGFEEIGLGLYLWGAPTKFYKRFLLDTDMPEVNA